jgi:hypothetical protein
MTPLTLQDVLAHQSSVPWPEIHQVEQVETNVSERLPKYPLQRLTFALDFRGERLQSTLVSYDINEMLGTKMRALFQRKKGRDLFDLYWALSTESVLPVAVDDIVSAFQHYMRDEHTKVPRAEFVAHLEPCGLRLGVARSVTSTVERARGRRKSSRPQHFHPLRRDRTPRRVTTDWRAIDALSRARTR